MYYYLIHGQYWCASLTAAVANFDYNIIPVHNNDNGFLKYSELVNRSWHTQDNIHYIVCYQNDDENKGAYFSKDSIIGFLGVPDKSECIGRYEILYWDKDISPYYAD